MAKANVQRIEVEPARPAVYREEVTLTLSKDEAETLRALLDHVGGSHSRSRRKHTSAISGALSRAGVILPYYELHENQRSIWFADQVGIN